MQWQGIVVPPYRAAALPMIDARTDEPNGQFRALVLGGERTFWGGRRGESSAGGPVCADRASALAEAERHIATFTDGLLDFFCQAVPDTVSPSPSGVE